MRLPRTEDTRARTRPIAARADCAPYFMRSSPASKPTMVTTNRLSNSRSPIVGVRLRSVGLVAEVGDDLAPFADAVGIIAEMGWT